MTPRERVMGLFAGQTPDRLPIFSGMSMVVRPALEKEGLFFPQIHTSAEQMARAAVRSAEMIGFDSIVVPFDITFLAEALGSSVNFYTTGDEIVFPTVTDRRWLSLEQVVLPDDIQTRGRIPMIARAIGRVPEMAPQPRGGICIRGPFTQIGQLVPPSVAIKSVFKARDTLEAVLDRVIPALIAVGNSWIAAGADYVTLSEPAASADVFPPKLFDRMIRPRLARILSAFEVPCVMHMSGRAEPLIDSLSQCGAEALAVDVKTDLHRARQALDSSRLLFGNFDVVTVPCSEETPPDAAAEAIAAIMAAGVDAVWPGADLWPEVRMENMEAIVATACNPALSPAADVPHRLPLTAAGTARLERS